MSLEDLRAQAETEEEATTEAEEPETQDEPEPEEDETEEGSSDEDEGGEAEEEEPSEDFELELDGEPEPDQQKPSPEDALVYKLTKQKQKTREYKSEIEELREELKALREGRQPQAQSRQQQPAQQYTPVPLLHENGIDTPEQYQKAYQKWVADCKAIDQRNAEADQQKSEYKRQMEDMTHNLAKRLGKFASEHKIKDERVISAAERATSEIDEATKIDGSLAYLLDSVGDGGERVAYYIGTNDAAMTKIKGLLQQDTTGMKAIAEMTRMAERLKPKHSSRTSKAPAPDRPIKGDGSQASSRKLQEQYDKASEKRDMKAMREAVRAAEKLGVRLK
jgi:hypothetical protein